MKVKPTDSNAVIRDPNTRRPLPANGADVPDNTFWRRRLAAGDVVRVAVAVFAVKSSKPVGNAPIAPLTTRALTKE